MDETEGHKPITITFYFFSFLSILTLFYIGLQIPIVRYKAYFFEKPEQAHLSPIYFREDLPSIYNRIHKKLTSDFKYHQVGTTTTLDAIVKVQLNTEGQIVGYKLYTPFYPNYFTTTQAKSILDKDYLSNKNKITFQIVKLTYH